MIEYSTIKRGFSLIELMITVVIISILASVAYPQYQRMITRSKQTEAKTMLQAIATSQQLYRSIHQNYANSLNELDLELPQTSKYSYTLHTNIGRTTFFVQAESNLDSDEALDTWQIDQTNTLSNIVNDAIE